MMLLASRKSWCICLSVELGRSSCTRWCSVWSIVSLSLAVSSSSAMVFCNMVLSRCLKKRY